MRGQRQLFGADRTHDFAIMTRHRRLRFWSGSNVAWLGPVLSPGHLRFSPQIYSPNLLRSGPLLAGQGACASHHILDRSKESFHHKKAPSGAIFSPRKCPCPFGRATARSHTPMQTTLRNSCASRIRPQIQATAIGANQMDTNPTVAGLLPFLACCKSRCLSH